MGIAALYLVATLLALSAMLPSRKVRPVMEWTRDDWVGFAVVGVAVFGVVTFVAVVGE